MFILQFGFFYPVRLVFSHGLAFFLRKISGNSVPCRDPLYKISNKHLINHWYKGKTLLCAVFSNTVNLG